MAGRAAMALGLSVREAEPFVACLRAGHEAADECADSIAAHQRKIDQVDALIERLTRSRTELEQRMLAAARRGFSHLQPTKTVEERPVRMPMPDPLPEGLAAPPDDGGADHLTGRVLPALSLEATDGSRVVLDRVALGRWVLFIYPLTGEPGVDIPRGWDQIPGARGCSNEVCSFRDELGALGEAGIEAVVALSSDASAYQRELAERLHLPYPLLSDPGFDLADEMGLPTFAARHPVIDAPHVSFVVLHVRLRYGDVRAPGDRFRAPSERLPAPRRGAGQR